MFTGIVECVGIVRKGLSETLSVEVPAIWKDVKVGSSVAVHGVCLTVVRKTEKRLYFNVIGETKARTVLGKFRAGQKVNLERSMKAGGRFEGHVVLGHVDGVGKIQKVLDQKGQTSFLIGYPPALKRFLVEKGSVAVNGVSMTLGKVGQKAFWVHCIPHTYRRTHFGSLKPGEPVNLEGDILAKFARLPAGRQGFDN